MVRRPAKQVVTEVSNVPSDAKRIKLPHEWAPRDYQLPVWNFFENGGKRAATVWHRRAGKDLTAINRCAVESMRKVGLYLHLFPEYRQGRRIAWEGRTKTGKAFLDAFPSALVESRSEQEMKLRLINGSIYQIAGADTIDSLVGSNPIGIILSEYSLINPAAWRYLSPILAENDGWAWFIFTPRGENHAYKLFEAGKKMPERWFTQKLTIEDTNAIPMAAIDDERAEGMDEETIQQEYWCSFKSSLSGSYYGQLIEKAENEGRITNVPYDPLLPVFTYWDIGVNDTNSIWFFQRIRNELRFIDFYSNSGEGLGHYINIINQKGYVYESHWAPFDIGVREYTTGVSRIETARSLGINFEITPRHSVANGIEDARNLLPMCWFDAEKCKDGIDALKSYRKEYDEERRKYKDQPVHDWSSHAADAFRYAAVNIRPEINRKKIIQVARAVSDYDPFEI